MPPYRAASPAPPCEKGRIAVLRIQLPPLTSVQDARTALQTAIGVEFGTLPPYLYALFSIRPNTNQAAADLIHSVVMQEMIHFTLDCNILNALGGDPVVTAPTYPGPLPGDIGPHGQALTLHLHPFSRVAMEQAMAIEEPAVVPDFPIVREAFAVEAERAVTIGEFYAELDAFLATLPASDWTPNRHQIDDDQFFAGQLFPVNGYADAHTAITQIVSEGEGALDEPLDFQHQIAHYYRFGEVFHDKVLTKTSQDPGYQWGPQPLGVDWAAAYPAIPDPELHDFSKDSPEARAAQQQCNEAYTRLIDSLQQAVTGTAGALGVAVRAMCDLAMAAAHAVTVPLADGKVAGPAFLYLEASA